MKISTPMLSPLFTDPLTDPEPWANWVAGTRKLKLPTYETLLLLRECVSRTSMWLAHWRDVAETESAMMPRQTKKQNARNWQRVKRLERIHRVGKSRYLELLDRVVTEHPEILLGDPQFIGDWAREARKG